MVSIANLNTGQETVPLENCPEYMFAGEEATEVPFVLGTRF